MDRVLRHSWFRSSGSLRIALPVLILLLGVGGYVLTSRTISSDRDAAAARRAQVESVQTQGVLGRARAYVAGLGNVLAGEPRRGAGAVREAGGWYGGQRRALTTCCGCRACRTPSGGATSVAMAGPSCG